MILFLKSLDHFFLSTKMDQASSSSSTPVSQKKAYSKKSSKGFYPRKEAKAAAPAFKKAYKTASPELQSVIDMVVDPDSQSSVNIWPMTYGLSSGYKSTNIIDAQFDQNGQSAVVVYPRLQNSIFATAGDVYTQALTVSGSSAGNYLTQQIFLSDSQPTMAVTDIWYFNNGHACIPRPTGIVSGINRFLYPFSWNSSDSTPLLNLQFSNVSSGDSGCFSVRFDWYNLDAAVIHSSTIAVAASGLISQNLNPVAATNITSWISIECIFVSGGGYHGTLTAQLRETGAAPVFSVTLADDASHMIQYDLNGAATILESAEMYFVSAQSLLCTYQGSDLQNGGQISTALVPGDTVLGQKADVVSIPTTSNPFYSWIASLAKNRYDGPIKEGSYCFLVPQDESDLFYKRVEDSFSQDRPYLVAAFSTTDPEQQNILRIKVVSMIQFTTNNTVYPSFPSPYCRDIKLLHNLLSIVPTAYSNPLHKAQIKEHLKKISKKIGSMLANPDNWISAARIAKSILL